MKNLLFSMILLIILVYSGGASASAAPTEVSVETGHGDVSPNGKGHESSQDAHQSVSDRLDRPYQPITVSVDGILVAEGDPPSAMMPGKKTK